MENLFKRGETLCKKLKLLTTGIVLATTIIGFNGSVIA
jgi:hypothetical protein